MPDRLLENFAQLLCAVNQLQIDTVWSSSSISWLKLNKLVEKSKRSTIKETSSRHANELGRGAEKGENCLCPNWFIYFERKFSNPDCVSWKSTTVLGITLSYFGDLFSIFGKWHKFGQRGAVQSFAASLREVLAGCGGTYCERISVVLNCWQNWDRSNPTILGHD